MSSKGLLSLLPCLRKEERENTDRSSSLLDNGSMLLEDLIASCDGKSNPIRNYSVDELIKATNNFHPSCLIQKDFFYSIFRGFLDNRSIIVKMYFKDSTWEDVDGVRYLAIRDIIISMQMSNHKNALKLLGCCLEFPVPALVHEYATLGALNNKGGFGANESLPWKISLRIAKQLANALTYLHTAFPRPIIHRCLSTECIFLGDGYVPKLSDFSLSITIPPMQSHVEDDLKWISGYVDPAYINSSKVTEKSDVYSFGALLLVFLTARQAVERNQEGTLESIAEYVKLHACDGQIQTILDPKISEEVREDVQAQQQLHDFLALALLCIQDEMEVRPDMIDVAKELVRIENSILPC